MSASPKGVTVLGATGTIGVNTLDVIARHPDRYRAVALTANGNVERLLEQCRTHRPDYAVVADPEHAGVLEAGIRAAGLSTRVMAGPEALAEVAGLPEVDYVMAAIVGGAGLLPSLAAAKAGKRVLLANKEALVMSGRLFMDQVRASGARLLPIDSEHNAIFQCMPPDFSRGLPEVGVERILLTASGGPFRRLPAEDLEDVTPDQACAHPNWVMGRKISVDSASMMNKGLELIEACWLFDTTPERVEVVLHPQSVIHSMVAYTDGSVLAQLGNPDMRTPIAHALAWPERIASGVAPLDIMEIARLDFERPDMDRFPCLRLAYEAFSAGGTATAILNAANEVAVDAFLSARIRFTDIPRLISHALETLPHQEADSLERILEADREAREVAAAAVREGRFRERSLNS
ncbi:1-deoxy-D-xylulose-5-phosphate reductoisomerase [Ectothiorhodospira lacustris]|uniref:1-deoxy-D-xylulose-5-phosphate reductoisomerase n=1 Tax=Ectothiorhodospira lacustris TaxID=2899127 RepID=UPI001EE97FED|nr:1-deoxy-D-xylulose-5-phosphate reductoisomerase [Ectothiorhodospira lacustris]MCG5509420.1 1-deoxy-D-xylulose-5-phosphate reductoisomerase [Ectothiorhodospira lacustris]MCG5521474.1 1-deoxy-D-xylulose-5-phosphate reductoisomerase [Ectothiorhodospira lacustris]